MLLCERLINVLAVVCGMSLTSAAARADIIQVPADQPTIQEGIEAASDGDEVIVADGTYTGVGNRDLDFGGKLITVRSANGPDNCIIDSQGSEADPHRGFYFHSGETADAVVEGFTIRNGFTLNGGGILCESSSPTIVNCAFIGNIVIAQANDTGNGGGIHCAGGASATIDHCVFIDNEAVSGSFGHAGGGGGIYCTDSNPTVTNCAFNNNQARHGGGIRMVTVSFPEVSDCTFSGNTATSTGGGMQNTAGSATIVTDCTFIGNTANFRGGGMFNFDSIPTVTNCAFIENTSQTDGGGMYNIQGAAPIVINCTFIGNAAANDGGGCFNEDASSTLTNCTFSENSAGTSGGGMANVFGSFSTVTNCILWGDTPDEIVDLAGAATTVSYSDVQGGWAGEGNINADPLFVDADGPDDIPGNEDDNLRLSLGSPAIDAADNTAVPEGVVTDLDGNPRFVDDPDTPDTGNPDGIHPIVDMGAYEFPDLCADDDGDGQVTICHIPPGNNGNAHTITVSFNALPAHLAHGDSCGPCSADSPAQADGGPKIDLKKPTRGSWFPPR